MFETDVPFEEQSKRLLNVALKSADQLLVWLEKSGRKFLVFDAKELVESLPFPAGVDTLIQLIACYRDHRLTIPSGRVERVKDPTLGKVVDVPVMKTEMLEVAELDRAIRYLVRQITDLDPNWDLSNSSY